jgi:MFS family permease
MATGTIQRPWRASLGILADAGFRRFWAADVVSRVGDATTILALPLIAILILGGGAFEVGLIGVAQLLAAVAFGLPAGAVVDRLGRRRETMIAADLGRAVSLLTIPVAAALGVLTLGHLLIVAAINASLASFFDVASSAIVPRLVGRSNLVEANAKLAVGRSAAEVSGPAIAGALIGFVGAAAAIVFDALSFVASAVALGGIRRDAADDLDAEGSPGPRRSIRADIVAGARFVVAQPLVRAVTATACWNNAVRTVAFTVLLVYAVRDVGLAPAVIGLAFAIGNVGFLVGGLVATRYTRRLGLGRAMVVSVSCFGPAMTLVVVAPPSLLGPAIAVMAFVNGFGIATHSVNQISLRQSVTPERMLARVAAVTRLLIMGALPLGAAIGGILGSVVGVHATLALGAVGLYAAAIPYLISPVHRLRSLPDIVETAG